MFAELIEWAMNLDREFAFLLLLPFAVALAGFAAEARSRTGTRKTAPPASSGHRTPMTGAWSRGM
jgi:hypothetical protein